MSKNFMKGASNMNETVKGAKDSLSEEEKIFQVMGCNCSSCTLDYKEQKKAEASDKKLKAFKSKIPQSIKLINNSSHDEPGPSPNTTGPTSTTTKTLKNTLSSMSWTKERWDLELNDKGKWDVMVAMRGPDSNYGETLKWFTTSVIRGRCRRAFRV